MKTKLLFISFAFFSISLIAQSKKFQVSPVIGVEFPFAGGNNDDYYNFEYTPRASVGAAFKISFSEKFTLQPEISLQLREVKIFEGNRSYRNSPVYIVLPIYAGYVINDSFTLLAGPRLGMDLSFSASYSTGSEGSSSNTTGESPEFGGVVGVQYTTPFKVFISVKGAYAFTTPDYAEEVNETALMIGVGRFF